MCLTTDIFIPYKKYKQWAFPLPPLPLPRIAHVPIQINNANANANTNIRVQRLGDKMCIVFCFVFNLQVRLCIASQGNTYSKETAIPCQRWELIRLIKQLVESGPLSNYARTLYFCQDLRIHILSKTKALKWNSNPNLPPRLKDKYYN